MSEIGDAPVGAEKLDGLRGAVLGLDRGAVRALATGLDQRIAAATRELHELQRRVAELEAEVGRHRDDDELEAAIELSRGVAAGVVSEARDEYERAVAAARREAEEIERSQSVELDDLGREVEVLRTQLRGRRYRLERTLRAAVGELEAGEGGSGSAAGDVGAAVRAFRAGQPED